MPGQDLEIEWKTRSPQGRLATEVGESGGRRCSRRLKKQCRRSVTHCDGWCSESGEMKGVGEAISKFCGAVESTSGPPEREGVSKGHIQTTFFF